MFCIELYEQVNRPFVKPGNPYMSVDVKVYTPVPRPLLHATRVLSLLDREVARRVGAMLVTSTTK